MTKTDPRKLMEQAVDVMRRSIAEPRPDGKTSPKVGCVLLKPDGTIETAYRGELRQGDHAEFTLLERKNRDSNLAGSILFATLEPCAPKARQYPKLGCAERIVLARIQQVWVGIEDPDPTVDRKGIKFLQDSGVQVHMFDRDLQAVIRAENRDFIAQALERAAAAEEKTPEVTLSSLERAPAESRIDDLSNEALEAYRAIAKIVDEASSPAFQRRLVRQGLLQQHGQQFTPTGFGLLLFGEEPRTVMPQAGLLATIHYPDGTEEVRNFEGPQVLVPDLALQWLRNKLPNPIDRSEARRRETNDPLFEIVREGIVNALVHRDYSIAGAKCQLIVARDQIEIRSPGQPVEPVTLKQMQSFNAPMLSRNPVLHYVFARMELAEERGLGLTSMKRRAGEAGLPLPRYAWEEPYLRLTIYRSPAAAASALPPDLRDALTDAERTGWQWLMTQGHTKSPEYAKAMKVDGRTARRHLNQFAKLGLVRKTGSARLTEYKVL
jgi:ATP-dependent DNA helicase RecG